MYTLPAASTATPVGKFSTPPAAGLPLLLPAMVVMTPVAASTRRTRLLSVSAMNRLPAASTATAVGDRKSVVEGKRADLGEMRITITDTVVIVPAPVSAAVAPTLMLGAPSVGGGDSDPPAG